MPSSRRSRRKKEYTPPPDLKFDGIGQAQTLSRTAVIVCKLIEQKLNTFIPQSLVEEISGIPPRSQTRTLASHSPRKRHNIPDSGPDPRGPQKGLTRDDTAAIASYVDDPSTTIKEKGAPWGDLAIAAGVKLLETSHFFPLGKRQINDRSIRDACAKDEDMINAICEEERELNPKQASTRENWRETQQEERPRPEDWFNTVHCDEFHVGIGTEVTKMFSTPAQNKGIELFANLPSSDLHILGDQGRIAQVLVNLVSNAIKFTDMGCVILELNRLGQILLGITSLASKFL